MAGCVGQGCVSPRDVDGGSGKRRQSGIRNCAGEHPGGSVVQDGNLKEPTRVCQLAEPVVCIYAWVYQKVQPSELSTAIML